MFFWMLLNLTLEAGDSPIDQVLSNAISTGRVPGVVAMVASNKAVVYSGAFGKRRVAGNDPMTLDTIFRIHSMTKPVTTVAVMQLVEKGKLNLDADASSYLPELADKQVITGFDNGVPILRPANKLLTLRLLLSHTSGLGYTIWDADLDRYSRRFDAKKGLLTPLVSQPGTRWQYSTGVDVAGRIVEKVSGQSLEEYFQQNIFEPLGMKDTSYDVEPSKVGRLGTMHQRDAAGVLAERPFAAPAKATSYGGGGGLNSTAADYVRFMQMILARGRAGDRRIVGEASIAEMTKNQIGDLTVRTMRTTNPMGSNDFEFHAGAGDKFGLGFQINVTPYDKGRKAGSLAWAGAANTFFWIDPKSQRCAVLMTQIVPFFDVEAVKLLGEFERAVYSK